MRLIWLQLSVWVIFSQKALDLSWLCLISNYAWMLCFEEVRLNSWTRTESVGGECHSTMLSAAEAGGSKCWVEVKRFKFVIIIYLIIVLIAVFGNKYRWKVRHSSYRGHPISPCMFQYNKLKYKNPSKNSFDHFTCMNAFKVLTLHNPYHVNVLFLRSQTMPQTLMKLFCSSKLVKHISDRNAWVISNKDVLCLPHIKNIFCFLTLSKKWKNKGSKVVEQQKTPAHWSARLQKYPLQAANRSVYWLAATPPHSWHHWPFAKKTIRTFWFAQSICVTVAKKRAAFPKIESVKRKQ